MSSRQENHMSGKGEVQQQRIVNEADRLFYQGGYENTSFATIADAVGISRGNFYYHFKSKDEILGAVIEHRIRDIQQMLNEWTAKYPQPRQRVLHFIDILSDNQEAIKNHGCPIGSLCTELAKLGHGMRGDAGKMFELMHNWLTLQFKQLGLGRDASQVAQHLQARTQGIATITNAFADQNFLRREVRHLKHWLDELIAQHQADNSPRPGS